MDQPAADNPQQSKRAGITPTEQARLLDLSNDAIIVRDVDDRIIYWNHGATEVYGWTRDEAIGRDLHTLLRTEFEIPLEHLITQLRQQDRMEGEVVQVTRDGRRRTLWCRWALDRDAEGRPGAILTTYNDITERKRVEAALRASEERQTFLLRLADTLREIADPIAIQNAATCVLGEYLGASRVHYGELTADDTHVVVTQNYSDGMPVLMGQSRLNGFGPTVVAALQAGQTIVMLDLSASSMLSEAELAAYASIGIAAQVGVPLVKAGRLVAVLAVHQSTPREWTDHEVRLIEETAERTWAAVERARAEVALRESEERFRIMADSVPQIVWLTDAEGRVEFFNKQWTLYTGAPYEPTTAAQIAARFVHPDDAAMTMEAFNHARRTGTTFAVEHRIRSAAGTYRWFLVRAEPYRDPQTGEIVRWFGASIDIHDRKQAEAAVRESEERFRAVADLVPDLLWSNDPNGWTDWCNQRWFDYTGQTLEAAQGYGWLDVIHPDDRDMSLQAFQRTIESGQPLRKEHRIRGVDGTYRWFLVQAQPVRDEAGTIMRWYGAATDIHQEQMALAEAEAALQTRDQFLSIASHELRTPLTSLIGYAYMLPTVAEQDEKRLASMTERIMRQAQRLNTLIEQLLDVSRLQRGQFVLDRQPVDLAALVTQVVDEFCVTLPSDTRHSIEVRRPNSPMIVAGDTQRLEQVIQNLLSNAVKYSPTGGRILIDMRHTPTEAIVEVADPGIGIPVGAQGRVFEAFYRASNIGPQTSGFGLGLHIVDEIVQRHGGRIEVESTEGQGSTFRVALPLANRAHA